MHSAATVERAIDVLFHLHGEPAACGVSAIGRALDLPKSNVHRLLAALLGRGLVERDDRGRYRPGVALLALGLGVLEREPVVRAARPFLEEIAHTIGETAFLVGPRASRVVILDKVEGSGFLRASPRVGDGVPLHATAVGRLHLAFAPERFAFPTGRLERFTDRTPATAQSLERSVARARRQGYALSRDEWIAGLSVIAAPVLVRRDADEAPARLEGALALAAASERLRALEPGRIAVRVVAAAEQVARRLEGPGSTVSSR